MKKAISAIFIIGVLFFGSWKILSTVFKIFHPDVKVCPEYMTQSDKQQEKFNGEFALKEYAELKDLGKSFLTILVAVFVASITFSEKIVDLTKSSWWAKFLMIACWILLLICISLTGAGIAFFSGAYTEALHMPCSDISPLWNGGSACFVLGGVVFGFALTSLLAAGMISFIHVRAKPSDKADPIPISQQQQLINEELLKRLKKLEGEQ